MFDGIPLQRSHGEAHISLDGGGLTELRQSGSGKVMLPRTYADVPEIVFLNTSGGLTAGDRLDYSLCLGAGMSARATTQTAERAYRAEGGCARATVTLQLGRGADLAWLPQETILFDGSALRRQTRVEMADEARFLGIETVVLGRAAMGETVARLALEDTRTVRRGGKLLLVDPLRLDDAALARAGGAALLGGARAFSTLIIAGPGTDLALEPLRAELDEPGVQGAASALNGRLVLRCLATDAWPLRRQMVRLISRLDPGGVPRCWQM
ncbi:urease accessory protein UreD [Paracoccus sp. Z118]|uniref:urease accessory protein UreD n=1 Tax=Paracoccus sp. Z118 TaxID=2851017 RepID=UPI001C2C35EA|nr:urease accessory protein UreD [Paracoccus sp. Z118]MBV0892530.1 urease accessory protein UreD [Paracoccus sp. Z118]